MGTRSLTFIYDQDNTHLVTIYRQFDGYPDGHGKDLAALADRKIVNGIGAEFETSTHANGFGDLSAKILHALKERFMDGGIYIVGIKDAEGDLAGADYVYFIKPDGPMTEGWNTPMPQVAISGYEANYGDGEKSLGKKLFEFHPSKYEAWLEEYHAQMEYE